MVFGKQASKPQQIQLEASALATGIHLAEATLQPGATIQFDLLIKLGPGLHGNAEAPNGWKLAGGGEGILTVTVTLVSFFVLCWFIEGPGKDSAHAVELKYACH